MVDSALAATNLHSNMDRLKRSREPDKPTVSSHLHSNMDRLKHGKTASYPYSP